MVLQELIFEKRLRFAKLPRLETGLRSENTVWRAADLTLDVALTVGRILRPEVPTCRTRIIAVTAM